MCIYYFDFMHLDKKKLVNNIGLNNTTYKVVPNKTILLYFVAFPFNIFNFKSNNIISGIVLTQNTCRFVGYYLSLKSTCVEYCSKIPSGHKLEVEMLP